MAKKNYVGFDFARFKKAAARLGYTQKQICQDMGVGNGYFNHRADLGTIRERDAFWLTSIGITPDMYEPFAEQPQESADVVSIRAAVRGAVKDVINERFSDDGFISALRDIIRPAVRTVVKEELDKASDALISQIREMFE